MKAEARGERSGEMSGPRAATPPEAPPDAVHLPSLPRGAPHSPPLSTRKHSTRKLLKLSTAFVLELEAHYTMGLVNRSRPGAGGPRGASLGRNHVSPSPVARAPARPNFLGAPPPLRLVPTPHLTLSPRRPEIDFAGTTQPLNKKTAAPGEPAGGYRGRG